VAIPGARSPIPDHSRALHPAVQGACSASGPVRFLLQVTACGLHCPSSPCSPPWPERRFAAPRPAAPRPAPLYKGPVPAAPRRAASLSPRAERGPVLSAKQTRRFMDKVARRENRFYQPGVGFDRQTGMTFDGQNIDFKTGKPVYTPFLEPLPSKESLHVALLVKALAGDHTAQLMISPDPQPPWGSQAARSGGADPEDRQLREVQPRVPRLWRLSSLVSGGGRARCPCPDRWSQKPDGRP